MIVTVLFSRGCTRRTIGSIDRCSSSELTVSRLTQVENTRTGSLVLFTTMSACSIKAADQRITNCRRSLQSFKVKTPIQMKAKTITLNRFVKWKTAALASLALASLASTPALAGDKDGDEVEFKLVRNTQFDTLGFPNFALNARGRVKIESVGPVEIMDVKVEGLPPNTDFDFFVIQIPHPPFGLAWYQGDIETNSHGVGHGRFIGRFNIETFIVSQPPGNVPSPVEFNNAFPDASNSGPPTEPIHTYHLGLWFNSPQDAAKALGPNTVTRFNGEHNAGVQVLNTSNFPDLMGPLLNVK
jgi:hypothetical protein